MLLDFSSALPMGNGLVLDISCNVHLAGSSALGSNNLGSSSRVSVCAVMHMHTC